MFIQHMMGILYHPKAEWRLIKDEHYSATHVFMAQISILAAIPAVSLYIGTTQIGWSIAGGEFIKLQSSSALMAAVAFYFAMWVAVGLIAYAIRWMEKTYGGEAAYEDCLLLTTFTATPMFISGLAGLYPMLWLNVMLVLAALSYSIYLLYTGVPIIMQISEDRAFLFASSVLTFGLCVLVGLMVTTVILWSTVIPLNYISG